MDIMDDILRRAKAHLQVVAFPEAEDKKIQQAAVQCLQQEICIPLFVGNADAIRTAAQENRVSIGKVQIADTQNEELLDSVISKYLELHPDTFFSAKALHRRAKDPLYVALMLQANGDADVTFAGIDHTTGDVILAGQNIVGMQEGITTISSIGIAKIPGFDGPQGEYLAFGDSAVCVNPSAEELASIAITACGTVRALVGWEPRCAMLSYSTCGSGESALVGKVVAAVQLAHEKRPDLMIDGEFQFDSAIDPATAAKKVKRESTVAGRANIVIWPNLDVGNIGVKLIQRFGRADAYGPMLQGFRKIVCDCSRGAPVSELVGNIAMSCVRAQEVQHP